MVTMLPLCAQRENEKLQKIVIVFNSCSHSKKGQFKESVAIVIIHKCLSCGSHLVPLLSQFCTHECDETNKGVLLL